MDIRDLVLRSRFKEKDNLSKPPRIAILDTEVNEEYAESMKQYKFAGNDDDDFQDNTSHKTNAICLIQKQIRPLLWHRSIYYAKDVYKVDIIVIPLGFKSPNKDMADAIDEANNANILIFSAASNYGDVTGIVFSGQIYIFENLFCMFFADVSVLCFPNFNPSISYGCKDSFAALGENVILPYVKKPLSGTSFATIIEAAIAGRVLNFSPHKETCNRIRVFELLSRVEGMSAVFAKMILPAVVMDEDPSKIRLR
ncbi:hypothetical protein B7463_g9750, partial [Scytalidium lignicola]